MDHHTRKIIVDQTRDTMQSGWHCSEGILLTVGDFYFPERLPEILRIAAPFAGGVGGTHEELCGAFTGGLMVIGAMHGRISARDNDDICLELCATFRERYLVYFGTLRCKDLRETWVGKPSQPDCAELTAQAAGILVDILE